MSQDAAAVNDEPLLVLANVESAYGPIRAIRGVSLKVQRGQIATVLGSNGAGKTTILKTISGIIDPRKGQVLFQGTSPPATRRRSCAAGSRMCLRAARSFPCCRCATTC